MILFIKFGEGILYLLMLFWLQLMPQGFYLIITHNVGLNDLSEVLDEREQTKIPTQELVQMAEFVLKNNFFQFNGQVK